MTGRIVVFVKAPQPGLVKTRLAREVGPEAACRAYRELADAVLRPLDSIPRVILRYAPDDARAEIEDWLRPGWSAEPQGPGDLGVRLRDAFDRAFAIESEPVMIIGSDCPWLTPADIAEAGRLLAAGEADVVFGPATDGGYWLVGLNRPRPGLFEAIPWSTERVLQVSCRRAADLGCRVRLLRRLSDVDTAADWRAYLRRRGRTGAERADVGA